MKPKVRSSLTLSLFSYRRVRPWILLVVVSLTPTHFVFAESSALPTPKIIGASWVYQTEGQYHNVSADLVDAIEDRGMVVSYTAHLASMLQRTAAATGAIKQVYDNAQSLLFCKADLTYELTARNPHNITLCPYQISIYTLTDEPGSVFLAIRAPELSEPDYAAIHQLLEQVIADTIAW